MLIFNKIIQHVKTTRRIDCARDGKVKRELNSTKTPYLLSSFSLSSLFPLSFSLSQLALNQFQHSPGDTSNVIARREVRACRAADRKFAVEDLCFNNYCDTSAPVRAKLIGTGCACDVCVRACVRACVNARAVCCARLRVDVRMDENDGQATAACEGRGERSPMERERMCKDALLGASLEGGLSPPPRWPPRIPPSVGT